jgi:hypothetical protein
MGSDKGVLLELCVSWLVSDDALVDGMYCGGLTWLIIL